MISALALVHGEGRVDVLQRLIQGPEMGLVRRLLMWVWMEPVDQHMVFTPGTLARRELGTEWCLVRQVSNNELQLCTSVIFLMSDYLNSAPPSKTRREPCEMLICKCLGRDSRAPRVR
jgi:hypothetical protein